MSAYLSASELSDLVGCKVNQRSAMRRWLDKNHWPYVVDIMGLPKVSRSYHDAKMSGESVKPVLDSEPNRNAFDIELNFDALYPPSGKKNGRK